MIRLSLGFLCAALLALPITSHAQSPGDEALFHPQPAAQGAPPQNDQLVAQAGALGGPTAPAVIPSGPAIQPASPALSPAAPDASVSPDAVKAGAKLLVSLVKDHKTFGIVVVILWFIVMAVRFVFGKKWPVLTSSTGGAILGAVVAVLGLLISAGLGGETIDMNLLVATLFTWWSAAGSQSTITDIFKWDFTSSSDKKAIVAAGVAATGTDITPVKAPGVSPAGG